MELKKKDILGYLLAVFFGTLIGGILVPMGHWAEAYLWGFLFLLCISLSLALLPQEKNRRRRLHQGAALILTAPFILIAMMIAID